MIGSKDRAKQLKNKILKFCLNVMRLLPGNDQLICFSFKQNQLHKL